MHTTLLYNTQKAIIQERITAATLAQAARDSERPARNRPRVLRVTSLLVAPLRSAAILHR